MARNDMTVFNKSKEWLADGTFDLDTNTFKLAICDNTVVPAATTTTPTLADFTEVGAAGTYTAGGTALTLTWAESGGTVTLDSTTNPTWAADGSNDTDAYWLVMYQEGTFNSIADAALLFIDLGGPVDMTTNPVTVTWDASGIITI